MPNVNEPKNLRGKNDVAKDYRGENTAWRSTGRYLWLAIRAHRFEKGFSGVFFNQRSQTIGCHRGPKAIFSGTISVTSRCGAEAKQFRLFWRCSSDAFGRWSSEMTVRDGVLNQLQPFSSILSKFESDVRVPWCSTPSNLR